MVLDFSVFRARGLRARSQSAVLLFAWRCPLGVGFGVLSASIYQCEGRARHPEGHSRGPELKRSLVPVTVGSWATFTRVGRRMSAPTCSPWTLAVTCPRSCVAMVQWFGAWYSFFALSSLLPIPSLLSSVLFWLRPVVLCTTHTGCLLITTVVLCTIEAGAATDLPDPNVFRSQLPVFLSSSASITSLVLLVPSNMSSRAVVLCTTHTS